MFLYRSASDRSSPGLDDLVRARGPERLPVRPSRDEVRAVLSSMDGVTRLMATLLYGSGLRLLECCRLRVKDVDFARRQIVVRRGKGDKDCITMLPAVAASELAAHLVRVRAQHQQDLAVGAGSVELPDALACKLPSAVREWPWQWVFPATRAYVDRETGQRRRHHLHETVVQQAVRRAVLASGITKRATCHTFQHSFATIYSRTAATSGRCGAVGHKDVGDDDIYTHVLNRGPGGVLSPAERCSRMSPDGLGGSGDVEASTAGQRSRFPNWADLPKCGVGRFWPPASAGRARDRALARRDDRVDRSVAASGRSGRSAEISWADRRDARDRRSDELSERSGTHAPPGR